MTATPHNAAKGFLSNWNQWRCDYFGHMPPPVNWYGTTPRIYRCSRCGKQVAT